jgi:hypothetical protein
MENIYIYYILNLINLKNLLENNINGKTRLLH